MSGRIDFSFDFRTAQGGRRLSDSGQTYAFYILGNFSGKATDNRPTPAKIQKVDLDNFESILQKLSPTLTLADTQSLCFQSIDDFHPDHWLGQIPLLSDLLALKAQLDQPSTAAKAVEKIQALFPDLAHANQENASVPAETQDDLIERLLGQKPDHAATTNTWDQYLQQLVSPHVSPKALPQHQQCSELVTLTLSQLIKAVLHHPEFQRLEALWRATEALVQDAADSHSVYLLDIGLSELQSAAAHESGALLEKLRQHRSSRDDAEQPILLVDEAFNPQSSALFANLSQIAQQLGGSLLGMLDDDLAQLALSADSAQLSQLHTLFASLNKPTTLLSYPRYLIRLPYGRKRDPLNRTEFEECSAIPQTHELLWANSSFLCARALARDELDGAMFEDAPAFSYVEDGESVLQSACAQSLNQNQVNALLGQGIMPLIAYRQQRGIRLLGLNTLA